MADTEEEIALSAISNDSRFRLPFLTIKSEEGRRRLAALADEAETIRDGHVVIYAPTSSHPLSVATKDWLVAFISNNPRVKKVYLTLKHFDRDDGTVEQIVTAATKNDCIWHVCICCNRSAALPRLLSEGSTVRRFFPNLQLTLSEDLCALDGRKISQVIENPKTQPCWLHLHIPEKSSSEFFTPILVSLSSLKKTDSLKMLKLVICRHPPNFFRLLGSYLPKLKSLTHLAITVPAKEVDPLLDGIKKNTSLQNICLRYSQRNGVYDPRRPSVDPPATVVALIDFVQTRNKFMANAIDEKVVDQHVYNKVMEFHKTARIDLYSLSMIYVMLRKHVGLVCSFQPTDEKSWWIESKAFGAYEQQLRSLNDPAALAEYNLAMQRRDGN